MLKSHATSYANLTATGIKLFDSDQRKQIDELTRIDQGWRNKNIAEVGTLTYKQSSEKYPLESLKLIIRNIVELP